VGNQGYADLTPLGYLWKNNVWNSLIYPESGRHIGSLTSIC
jgi:hypothetical protein